MSAQGRPKRSDFFEPVRGWQIWRRGAKRSVEGGLSRAETDRAERPGAGHAPGALYSSDAPDFVDPVIGWRVWRVVRCKGRFYLASAFNNIVWVPGSSLDARCLSFVRVARHASPDVTCHCGVYAATRDALDWQLLGRRARTPLVVGTVSLWGAVVEAERGWRAGHAYPEQIFVPTVGDEVRERDLRMAESLTEYGVPVKNVLVTRIGALMPAIDVLYRGGPAAEASI
jgi:hypothetical protein